MKLSGSNRLLFCLLLGATLLLQLSAAHADTTELISIGEEGVTGGRRVLYQPGGVSADGRFVVFSTGFALVPEDTNGAHDIYVRDRQIGKVVRVSVGYNGQQGTYNCGSSFYISADGRYVTFGSPSANLVPSDTNGTVWDVFIRDRDTDEDGIFDEKGATTTELVSVNSNEVQYGYDTNGGSMSDDGRFILFKVGGALNVRDRVSGTTQQANLNNSGNQINNSTWQGFISGDGRHVAFMTYTAGVPEDTNGTGDVYVRDLLLNHTSLVSTAWDGALGNNESLYPSLSYDGRFVGFTSIATNLVQGDTNGLADFFVHDRDLDGDGVFDESGSTTTVRTSVSTDGTEGNAVSNCGHSMSADGRFFAFSSNASNLYPGYTSQWQKVFLHDRDSDGNGVFDEAGGTATTAVSKNSYGEFANDESSNPYMSADGNVIAFSSYATNLVEGISGENVYALIREGIQIIQATYDYVNDSIFVSATSTGGIDDDLSLQGYGPMTWNSGNSTWEITVPNIAAAPSSLTVTGVPGSVTIN